ncbi:MAG: NERD domain-containing protein [Acutalibacteraceae bacterium]
MLYFLIISVIVISVFSLPIVKGMIGETIIKIVIGKNSTNLKNPKFIINNLVLETAPEKTSQIDHVVINQNGVFVIETKNYSGRIYGNDSQQNWTQVLNYGKVKNHFYNPVKQNHTHKYKIQELLPQGTPIFPIVVFVKGNTLFIQSKSVYTVRGAIRKLKTPTDKQLSFDEMSSIYDILANQNKSNTIRNSEHVENIKKMKYNIDNNICPRCGNTLVLRHGKYGNFIGCSNFPKCRFTQKTK